MGRSWRVDGGLRVSAGVVGEGCGEGEVDVGEVSAVPWCSWGGGHRGDVCEGVVVVQLECVAIPLDKNHKHCDGDP